MASAMQRSKAVATRLLLHRPILLSSSPDLHLPHHNPPQLQHVAEGCFFVGLQSFSRGSCGQDESRYSGASGRKYSRELWNQDRRAYGASSSTSKSETTDGDAIASQMIGYASASRKNVESHVEVSRVLEQGYNFLLSQGPSKANAAGKVLLTLATFHVDGGKLLDAVDVLQQADNLEGASAELRVSARQALVGVLLRLHKDSEALSHAHSTVDIVNQAQGLPLELVQELKFRAAATVQFVEHASSLKTSGSLLDMGGLSSWLNHKEAHLDGVAAALLGIAECAHIRGHFSQAKDYYEKALALAETSLGKGTSGLSAGAMTAEEVLIGAEAGLGQVATHLGNFDDAEVKLTKALTHAEQINGEKHPRVGAVLACLADVYAQRGIARGSGDLVLTEGLYRRATDLLGAPPLHIAGSVQDVDLSDVIAISRARYAALLLHASKRETEALKLQTWASAAWKGPGSFTDVFSQEPSTQPTANTLGIEEVAEDAYRGRNVVFDVRLGRVLYSPSNL